MSYNPTSSVIALVAEGQRLVNHWANPIKLAPISLEVNMAIGLYAEKLQSKKRLLGPKSG